MSSSPKTAAAAAIERAVAKVAATTGRQALNRDLSATMAGATLPSAAPRRVLDALLDAGTPENVPESFINMKAVLHDVMDWLDPSQSKSTKTIAKAVGAMLSGSDDLGRSTFPQAVEVIGFLSLIGPLLEPDRIARVVEHAQATSCAYGPTLYPIGPSGQLKLMLAHYSEVKREKLLCSLWDAAHDPRWWEHTTGDNRVQHRRRARQIVEEDRQRVAAEVQDVLENHDVISLDLLTQAILLGTLSSSGDLLESVARMTVATPLERRDFVAAVAASDNTEHQVVASRVGVLAPAERPESPLATMIALLLRYCGGPVDFDPKQMPDSPAEWSDLYPAASREPFPFPEPLRALTGTKMPGLVGTDMTLLLNADQLKRNGDYMGNCTFSYANRCEEGTHAIGRISYRGVDYNISFGRNGNAWTIREVNSRFNAGGVPAEVREAAERFAGLITARCTRA